MTITPELMLFGALAGGAAAAAVGVVAFNNAVRSALCLVFNFILLAVVYFTLAAETVGIMQIVVYTGAIMVLFLFVIMLLNLNKPMMLVEKSDPKVGLGMVFGVALFGLIASQTLPALLKVTRPNAPDDFGAPQNLGRALFTNYVVPFEAISLLLLVGLVGSIMLAKRRI